METSSIRSRRSTESVEAIVIVVGRGGLGNQLFQLSFAHCLAQTHSQRVSFFLPTYEDPGSSISILLEKSDCVDKSNLLERFWVLVVATIRRRHRTPFLVPQSNILKDFFKMPGLMSLSRFTYIYEGYWQKWGLVESNGEKFLCKIMKFIDEEINYPLQINSQKESLVIHIRRGDYLQERNRAVYGVLTLNSYLQVINGLRLNHPNLDIVTVTDSPDIVMMEGAGYEFGKVLGPEDCSAWQALKLMKSAKIVIAGNSTLSWWGAYLAVKSGGQAFIPNPWFANYLEEANLDKHHPEFSLFDASYASY